MNLDSFLALNSSIQKYVAALIKSSKLQLQKAIDRLVCTFPTKPPDFQSIKSVSAFPRAVSCLKLL